MMKNVLCPLHLTCYIFLGDLNEPYSVFWPWLCREGPGGSLPPPPVWLCLRVRAFAWPIWTWRISWPDGLGCFAVFLTPSLMHANTHTTPQAYPPGNRATPRACWNISSSLTVHMYSVCERLQDLCRWMWFLCSVRFRWFGVQKKKKTLGNSPNKPHILFMIHSKSQLIALTGAVKPYLLIMLAFQWHPRFDRF